MSAQARPLTKAARQNRIRELLVREAVSSQSQLAQYLAQEGVEITQATISRDLVELGAVRVLGSGGPVYMVDSGQKQIDGADSSEGQARLRRVCAQVLLDVQVAGNLLVAHTPPGAANFLASALDGSTLAGVMGTIAGDDTVLLIAASSSAAREVRERLFTLSDGR